MPDLDIKGVLDNLHAGVNAFNSRFDKLQSQVDAIDLKLQNPGFGKSGNTADLAAKIWENSETKALRERGQGHSVTQFPDLSLKTLISSSAVGSATSGVLQIQRTSAVVPEARRRLRLYDLLTVFPATSNAVDFVKISSFSKVVSPQTEGNAKGESEMLFTTSSANVQTIATWIPASVQVLEDFGQLQAVINGGLRYAVLEEVEDQILSGSGVGTNLNGLTTQATAYDTSLTVAADGWEKVDLLLRAKQQIETANEISPDFCVLNPTDYYGMRAIKDTTGRYVFDRPDGVTAIAPIWGLTPILTTGMTAGYFLVGSSDPAAAAIFERSPLTVDISREHSTYFVENKVAIRCETRLALVVFRPASFVYGALNTSPA